MAMIDRAALDRTAASSGMLGAIALAYAYLSHPSEPTPQVVASTSWAIIHVGFLISLVAGIFLLFALFARLSSKDGVSVIGVAGFLLAEISLMFVIGLDYSEIFIFPELAVSFPDVVDTYGDGTMMPSVAFAFGATGAMFMIGFVLFAIALTKAGILSRPWSAIVVVGTLLFGLGLSGLFPMLVVRVGATLFAVGLIGLSSALLKPDQSRG